MASVKKFDNAAVVNILRHNRREIVNPANHDIDASKENANYSFLSERGMSDYEYFLQRKAELYCYDRSDVKVLAGWVVTAPQDLPPEQYNAFFKTTFDFLQDRYGAENTVQAVVHADESGQPHLHFCFIPVVADRKHGGEKICANKVLTRSELRNFHPALQRCLNEHGINAKVMTGITQKQGGNKTVKELKQVRNWTVDRQSDTMSVGRW